MNATYQHFRIDLSLPDRITIWIDVQDRSVNALGEPVFDELMQIIDAAARQARNLPLVFRSAKANSFVVGADLRRILSIETDAEVQQFLLHGQNVFNRLEHFEGTTVAVIHGPCLGGGLELALACDFRVAVEMPNTQLGMPESKLGLLPAWGGTVRLIETVGVENGLPMLLTGESVEPLRACDLGLVDAMIHEPSFEEELTDYLHRLTELKNGMETKPSMRRKHDRTLAQTELARFDLSRFEPLSAAQKAIYRATSIGIMRSKEHGLSAEREQFFSLLKSAEAQEHLNRFVNRPKPSR